MALPVEPKDATEAQASCQFLVLTSPVEGPWQGALADQDNRFIFSEARFISNMDAQVLSYYHLMKEFRERLCKNNYASKNSAQGWTMAEVESLVKLWQSKKDGFRIFGKMVFPEVFEDQPLQGAYAHHGAYNYMVMRMWTGGFKGVEHEGSSDDRVDMAMENSENMVS